jgi:hypothetical protein
MQGINMNATEHIIESYFRLCRGCFTCSDKKVDGGNNRQFDILAYDLTKGIQYHIEVSVTHQLNWCLSLSDLRAEFDKKFFGAPPVRKSAGGGTTDYEKGKSYFMQIEDAYRDAGFSPEEVNRVWVCWVVKGEENSKPIPMQFYSEHLKKTYEIEVLSLRDFILPKLEEKIGTAHYDDEILRTLGLLKQRESQQVRA